MSNVQTFVLTVNPQNGVVILPKKARESLGITSESTSILLSISDQKGQFQIPQYTLEEVLNSTPKAKKTFSDKQIKQGLVDEFTKKFRR